jgi:DNA-binding MarR family transcriptional regulator
MAEARSSTGARPSTEVLDLTRCNCLALRQATRRVTQFYDQVLAPTGLRITQYAILAKLAGRPTTMKALAETMVMDRATLGHNLRPIEAQGLISLSVGSDRRSRIVALTATGQTRLADGRRFWLEAQRRFEACYGESEATSLRQTLTDLAHRAFDAAAFQP